MLPARVKAPLIGSQIMPLSAPPTNCAPGGPGSCGSCCSIAAIRLGSMSAIGCPLGRTSSPASSRSATPAQEQQQLRVNGARVRLARQDAFQRVLRGGAHALGSLAHFLGEELQLRGAQGRAYARLRAEETPGARLAGDRLQVRLAGDVLPPGAQR